MTTWTRTGILGGLAVAGLLAGVALDVRAQPRNPAAGAPPFLEVNQCYRFTFPIAGAPQWKVIEIGEGGWVRAEVDAGSASAARDAAWVNTAQLITVRPARCGA